MVEFEGRRESLMMEYMELRSLDYRLININKYKFIVWLESLWSYSHIHFCSFLFSFVRNWYDLTAREISPCTDGYTGHAFSLWATRQGQDISSDEEVFILAIAIFNSNVFYMARVVGDFIQSDELILTVRTS